MNVFIDGIQIFTTIAVDSVKQHALLPLAFALGQGRAIQRPLAIAIISGLIMQLPLVLLLLPVPLQLMMKRRSRGQSAAKDHED